MSLAPASASTSSFPSPNPNRTHSFPCRFLLDNSTSSILTLPSGRKLSYAQYGDPNGKPVFFFHGLPGSRLEGTYFDDLGKELGARIISPDRPGCGQSTPQPGRGLLDWPKDVEALAEHLKLAEYSIMVCLLPHIHFRPLPLFVILILFVILLLFLVKHDA
ncbi:predicted protein [Plenodomus lingam JN3]|uniref:Predicted protein n=1 Tax=Leptosphaeria maculans (strain JN3 / isolate v23.1.3 / race Av1-4-5-6-7-8) TaxID=985895 RepID=E4ZJB9_LEPMJ|nr:predicted protein [Plenodomus lingam JN3]CBX91550.1 predicted protein [Plenodomus lingam JN3]